MVSVPNRWDKSVAILGFISCADPESFVSGGPTSATFFSVFLVDEGREDPNTTISEPSSAHQRTFRWRADDDQLLNAGLVAAIFRGSGPLPPPPSVSALVLNNNHVVFSSFIQTKQEI